MKLLTLAALFSVLCHAAIVTVCSSGCTTTSLQAALDTLAACGDTIQIKSTETQSGSYTITYRGCGSNPITVTSDRASTWLPNTLARVTPSQLANMAVISAPGGNPGLSGVLDSMSRPPAGWNFIGVAFTNTNTVGGGAFYLIGFNGSGTAANSSQIADNITFDRCYFFTPAAFNGINMSDMIRGDVTNLTVKNSFFGDGFLSNQIESHSLRMLTTAGPVTATNNFIVTSGAPIFSGGAVPSYPAYLENGLTAQFNYFWRPWKWNGDPAQPFAADYVTAAQSTHRTGPWTITNVSNTGVITTAGSPPFIPWSLLDITGVGGCTVANANNWRNTQLTANTFQLLNFPGCNSTYTSGGAVDEFALTVCTKNLGEMKWGTGITWQYNVGENSWWANQCQAQYTGFTDTVRTEWENPGTIFSLTNATHVTWTGSYRIGVGKPDIGDMAICLQLSTGTECHAITSYSGATLVSATAFSSAPAGTFNGWVSYTSSAKLQNVSLQHNVYKNVDQPFSILALSFAKCLYVGSGCDAGYGKTNTVAQNLAFVNTSYVAGVIGLGMLATETDYVVNPSGYTFDHNTIYTPYGFTQSGGKDAFFYAFGSGTATQPTLDSSSIQNNLFGVSATHPFGGDGNGNDVVVTANQYFSNSLIRNNGIPGGAQTGSATGGNTVSGNIYTAWADPFGGLAASGMFNVQPASAYYHAGTDGASLGADFTQLPMVNGCVVTANVLNCDLTSGVNSDAKNTQPVVLEVSASRNLISDLGTYSVIANVDPTITPGADLSTRSDVILTGSHIAWPLTGVTPGTTYYWRLQAYGDMEMGSFVATNPATGSGSLRSGKSKLGGKVVIH